MITDIYLHGSKEENYEKGIKLGLKDEALDEFMYTCYEVKVTIDVDENTGKSKIIAVDDKQIIQ